MKKIIFFIIFLLIINPVYSQTSSKIDVNSGNFIDLGRYIEVFEINDEIPDGDIQKDSETEDFEEAAISDISKRYEKNTVELKLDDISDNAINDINSERIFKLQVNETQYKIENQIKNENMIWDGSKAFSNAFYNDSRQMAPIPGIVNSAKLQTSVSPSLYASFGQTFLYSANNTDVIFIRANESTYNTGSVISYNGSGVNLSVGSFSSSFNNAASGGAILSSNSLKLPSNSGSVLFGSAFYTKEDQDYNKATGGFFGQYAYKRLKLNAQIGQSKYSNSYLYDTSLYLIPELKITDSIYLKTRFIRNITQHTMQDELALTYKPKNNKNCFEFEINASNYYSETNTIKQRIKFSTSFRI